MSDGNCTSVRISLGTQVYWKSMCNRLIISMSLVYKSIVSASVLYFVVVLPDGDMTKKKYFM